MKLLGSNVKIKRTKKGGSTTKGGIILSETHEVDDVIAEVLDIGPGELLPCGQREDMGNLKPGDKVVCYPGYGHNIDTDIYIVDITEIEAVERE